MPNRATIVKVRYDPINGVSVSDGLVDSYVNQLISVVDDRTFLIGSGIIIDALRVRVKRGEISLIAYFNDYTITFENDGGAKSWPDGFCDINHEILMELFG